MEKNIITIVTPVYNRSNLLGRLYESLIKQTDLDFDWLIVDDGSTDNVRNVVEHFIKDNILNIKYIFQKNQGKYVAHNTGVRNCETELFVCVDSDDWLLPEAICETKKAWERIKNDVKICGIVSPKKIDGVGGLMKNPPCKSSLMGLYNSGCLTGETMLVYKTDILKKFLFPEIVGEKFMSESVIYNQIDKEYVMYVQNVFLYEAEYQNNGLTRNIMKTHWNNPKSTLINYAVSAAFQESFVKSAKAYGCMLAWKKIHNLPEKEFWKIKYSVRVLGNLLKWHYIRVFRRQKKKLEVI